MSKKLQNHFQHKAKVVALISDFWVVTSYSLSGLNKGRRRHFVVSVARLLTSNKPWVMPTSSTLSCFENPNPHPTPWITASCGSPPQHCAGHEPRGLCIGCVVDSSRYNLTPAEKYCRPDVIAWYGVARTLVRPCLGSKGKTSDGYICSLCGDGAETKMNTLPRLSFYLPRSWL